MECKHANRIATTSDLVLQSSVGVLLDCSGDSVCQELHSLRLNTAKPVHKKKLASMSTGSTATERCHCYC